MPIPSPNKGETQQDFVSRCMRDNVMLKEYPQDQRAAICYRQFKKAQAADLTPTSVDGPASAQNHQDPAQGANVSAVTVVERGGQPGPGITPEEAQAVMDELMLEKSMEGAKARPPYGQRTAEEQAAINKAWGEIDRRARAMRHLFAQIRP